MFKSVIWASSIDFPGHIATVLFVGRCNWSCSYCHNKSLAALPDIDLNEEILPRLKGRKEIIDHVVISGGEPTLYDELPDLIWLLNEMGFTVGLHTNGSNPEMLIEVLPMLGFVGMDIKSSATGYRDVILSNLSDGVKVNHMANVPRSVEIIADSGVPHEFRTTVLPSVTSREDLDWIARYLKGLNIDRYIIQQFNDEFIDSTMTLDKYDDTEVEEMKETCCRVITTEVRGIRPLSGEQNNGTGN